MRKYLICALLISSPLPAFSDEIADKALKAFAEQTVKSFGQTMAAKQLDRLASNMIDGGTSANPDAPGYVSQALATYSLYKNTESLLDAETQSQKYYASVQVAASIVSFAYPLVGTAIGLIGAGQQVLGDAYVKNRMERLLREKQLIIDLQRQIEATLKKNSLSDAMRFQSLIDAYEILMNESLMYQAGIEHQCQEFSPSNEDRIFECAEMALRSFYALKNANQFLERAVEFRSVYFAIDDYFAQLDPTKSAAKYRQTIRSLSDSLAAQEKQLRPLQQSLSDSLTDAYFELLAQTKRIDPGLHCTNSLLREINILNRIDFQILAAKKDSEKIGVLLTQRDYAVSNSAIHSMACGDDFLKGSKSLTQVEKLKGVLKHSHLQSFDKYFQEIFQ